MPPGALAGEHCRPRSSPTAAPATPPSGRVNSRYPDLYKFKGTLADFSKRVREGSPKGMTPFPAELVSDADVSAMFAFFTGGTMRRGLDTVTLDGVVPLFQPADAVNKPIVFLRDDGVLVTRGSGRVRGRHEGPLDTNQPFMQWVSNYFNSRTYGFIVEDFTVKGESRIRVTYLPVANPTAGTNFRAWKVYSNGDVFAANMGMTSDVAMPPLLLGGTDLAADYQAAIAPYARIQQQTTTRNARTGQPIKAGDLFEFEFGIFIDGGSVTPAGSRTAYYTDTFRYKVGVGGLTADNPDAYDGLGNLGPTREAQQGGDTTNVWAYYMPETQFGQMALNMQHENVQRLVRGRRLFHTDFETGEHSERRTPRSPSRPARPGRCCTTTSCESCHMNNGPGELLRGPLAETSSMVIKLYDAGKLGNQLQLQEGSAAVSGMATQLGHARRHDGHPDATDDRGHHPGREHARLLRADRAARSSAWGCSRPSTSAPSSRARTRRIATATGSRAAQLRRRIPSPAQLRLARFGWKAEKVSVQHQVAEAASDDMGVGTSLFPENGKAELSDAELADSGHVHAAGRRCPRSANHGEPAGRARASSSSRPSAAPAAT